MARSNIVKFFLPYCKKHGYSLNYLPGKDTFFLHLNGRAIMTFTTEQFYSIPKASRSLSLRALKTSGLVRNLADPGIHEQIFMEKTAGHKLIRSKTINHA